MPTGMHSPTGTISPVGPSFSTSALRITPPPTRTEGSEVSMTMLFIRERSITTPPLFEENPPGEVPPARTEMRSSRALANRIATATSRSVTHLTMTAGL